MAWKNNTCMSNVRDFKNRKRKLCCCGGHNANNPKRNMNHNSTKKQFLIRQSRQIVYLLREG